MTKLVHGEVRAMKPIYEKHNADANNAEHAIDPTMHRGNCQCFDGCGACDGCGRWIGDESVTKLVPISHAEAEKIDTTTTPEIGQWFWVKLGKDDQKRYGVERRLACITHVGSNYVEVTGPSLDSYSSTTHLRVHFDRFDAKLTPEPDALAIIAGKVAEHRTESERLLREVQRVAAQLGVAPRDALAAESENTTALATVSGTANIKAHKTALIKAKTETLPELFKQIEAEHEWMVKWMKANTIPDKARFAQHKKVIDRIDGQIFTVELYAGLIESLVKVKDGAPAPNDTKLVLFQRRHYMDEECLVKYEAGGMEFADITGFDAWLARPDNFERILAKPRCVVAFKVRRERKHREGRSLGDWITILNMEKADESTFLYIRNGEQLFRLQTEIEFGEQLFPDSEHNELLLGGQLYWDDSFGSERNVKTQREYDTQLADHKKAWAEYQAKLAARKAEPRKDRSWEPSFYGTKHPDETYEKLDHKSVHYDDGMNQIAELLREHNQISVLLQGLLDRSLAFHPHPPWRLWTPEGFLAGIELLYDDSRALVDGDAPDFVAYWKQLNAKITKGSFTLGQRWIWGVREAIKEEARRDRSWRSRNSNRDLTYFEPYGNPGPAMIAQVDAMTRTGRCTFTWCRERQGNGGDTWIPDPKKPGWMKRNPNAAGIPCKIVVSREKLFNVSAYTPGDFLLFYRDPRTRAQYLKWAPFLLAAEDWHAQNKGKPTNAEKDPSGPRFTIKYDNATLDEDDEDE